MDLNASFISLDLGIHVLVLMVLGRRYTFICTYRVCITVYNIFIQHSTFRLTVKFYLNFKNREICGSQESHMFPRKKHSTNLSLRERVKPLELMDGQHKNQPGTVFIILLLADAFSGFVKLSSNILY